MKIGRVTQILSGVVFILLALTSCATPGAPAGEDSSQVFIPGGVIELGSDDREKAYGYRLGGEGARKGRWFDSEVKRRVYVNAFHIDKYPVTQAAYLEFVEATGHRIPFISRVDYTRQGFLVHSYEEVLPYLWRSSKRANKSSLQHFLPETKLDHPVVLVSLTDAESYCKWRGLLETGREYSLPTEDEWEKAARGTDRRYFPWGDVWDDKKANIWKNGPHSTSPVTAHPDGASPYGASEMAGNIFEWTETPLKPGSGRYILKSCSWDDEPGICRGAARHSRPAGSRHILIGFRCVARVVR